MCIDIDMDIYEIRRRTIHKEEGTRKKSEEKVTAKKVKLLLLSSPR